MMEYRPPRLAEALLRKILPGTEHATVIGELREEYLELVVAYRSRFKAHIWFWRESLSLVASYTWAILARGRSRDITVIMEARRFRKRSAEYSRSRERSTRMDALLQDVRHGFRSLSKRPSFTAAAMLTLAIGIGVNAAIFSMLHAVLLQPLPFEKSGQLVSLYHTSVEWGRGSRGGVSYPDFVFWKGENHTFSDMACWHEASVNLTGGGTPERLDGAAITFNMMSLLGVQPALGRGFLPDEDVPDAPGVVILSHGLWQRRFGGDQNIVGKTIALDKEPVTVVGIAPKDFQFPAIAELWVPMRENPTGHRDILAFWVIGRLRDGVSLEDARYDMGEIDSRLAEQYPDTNDDLMVGIQGLRKQLSGEVGTASIIFYGVVCLVLLLACANIMNLMLALSSTRSTEIAIRSSLGAGRTRIVRQLLTESVLLAVAGGTIGVFLGILGRNLLLSRIPVQIPFYIQLDTNISFITWMIGIMILTGIIFGSAPALTASRPDLIGALQRGSSRATGGVERSRLRSSLIVLEVTVATLMLAGSGLLMKSYVNIKTEELGFVTDNVLTMSVSLPDADYPDDEVRSVFYRDLSEHIRSIPGVMHASTVAPFPLGPGKWLMGYTLEGTEPTPDDRPPASLYWAIQTDYFRAMQIPVLQGRNFSEEDGTEGIPPAVIVTKIFADRNWPGENPLGKRMKWGRSTSSRPWMDVVGVVGDIFEPDPFSTPSGGCYIPLPSDPSATASLVIKTVDDPLSIVDQVRTELTAVDPNLPLYQVQTLENVMWQTEWPLSVATWLFVIFALIALTLAAVGIYGVIAYSVTQRTREFGVRIALGASLSDVIRMVIRQITGLAGLGVLLGLAIAFAGMQLASAILYEVSPSNPIVYILSALAVGGVAIVASYIPARRATRIDPMDALRQE